jgi:hypothetical protein
MGLIDADALRKEIDFLQSITEIENSWNNGYVTGLLSIKDVVKTMPTIDAVEVVRCKDCSYSESDEFDWWYCHYHGNLWNKGDHFCSDGERIKS